MASDVTALDGDAAKSSKAVKLQCNNKRDFLKYRMPVPSSSTPSTIYVHHLFIRFSCLLYLSPYSSEKCSILNIYCWIYYSTLISYYATMHSLNFEGTYKPALLLSQWAPARLETRRVFSRDTFSMYCSFHKNPAQSLIVLSSSNWQLRSVSVIGIIAHDNICIPLKYKHIDSINNVELW